MGQRPALRPPRSDLLAVSLLAALVAAFFFDVLVLGNGFYLRDLTTYHFPIKRVVREIIRSGEFPYWNPYVSAGQPMAANPAYEIFYPLQWLIFLPDFHFGNQLHILVHVFVGLVGMYALLRSFGLGTAASLFGSISFGLSGYFLSLLNLLPALFSFSWTPLVVLFARRFFLQPAWRSFAFGSIAFGLQMLIGEPATIVQTAILVVAFAADHGLTGPSARLRLVGRNLGLAALLAAGAMAVAAVQLVPAIDFLPETDRGKGFPMLIAGGFSMPPVRPLELIYPHVFGSMGEEGRLYWGTKLFALVTTPYFLNLYFGLFGTVLAIAGLLLRYRHSSVVACLTFLSFLLAIGIHTPLFDALWSAGLFRAIRYPERFVLLGLFALTLYAALMFQRLLNGDRRLLRLAIVCAVLISAAALVAALLTLRPGYEAWFGEFWRQPDQLVQQMARLSRREWWLSSLFSAMLVVLLLWKANKPARAWTFAAMLFLLGDLGRLANELIPRMPRRFFDAPPIVSKLPENRSEYRIFHVADWLRHTKVAIPYFSNAAFSPFWMERNGLFPYVPTAWGFRTALDKSIDSTVLMTTRELIWAMNKIRQMHPEDWIERLAAISNVQVWTAFRPFDEAVRLAGGDPEILTPVDFVVGSAQPRYYFAERLVTIRDKEEFVRGLASTSFTPRTAFVPFRAFRPGPARLVAVSETSNRVRLIVSAEDVSYLVASTSFHRYWKAELDGRRIPIHCTNLAYQGLIIPPGTHEVRLVYRNPLVMPALMCSCLWLLVLIALAARSTSKASG